LRDKVNWLLSAIVLVAGLLIGFAGSTLAYRYGLLNVPNETVLERMDRVLKLTPVQHEQIAEVMEETRSKVIGLHNDFQHQRRMMLTEAYDKIRTLLTTEQQKEFDSHFMPPGVGRHEGGHHR
jgi:uncharacterized membrane-anchored protein YhcB (DUF1043 family)